MPPTVPPYVGMARKQNGAATMQLLAFKRFSILPGGEFYESA